MPIFSDRLALTDAAIICRKTGRSHELLLARTIPPDCQAGIPLRNALAVRLAVASVFRNQCNGVYTAALGVFAATAGYSGIIIRPARSRLLTKAATGHNLHGARLG